MGWDIDRFPEGEVNLELICCICTCILEDPVESPCRHVFCSQCIKTWLSNQKSCPHCRAPVHKKDLQSVVPLLKNIISKQRIFCDNKERGCPEIVHLESLQSHVAGCPYGLVCCANDGCSVKIMRRDVKVHSDICAKRTVVCEQGCEMFLTLGERNAHNCVQALRAHFQEATNEMHGRISKLEELVNVMVSKNSSNQRPPMSRTDLTLSDTYSRIPYSIPSPRPYDARPPPYTVFAGVPEVNTTVNLTGYSVENNEFSDSVESVDSDTIIREDDFPARTRHEPVSPAEREMSPVYDHLDRTSAPFGTFRVNRDERRRERRRDRRDRSRSPHSQRSLDTTYTRNSSNGNRSDRETRSERHSRNYEYNERTPRRSDTTNPAQEEPLVLRIGVSSQTVSDSSSSSSSSSGTDTD